MPMLEWMSDQGVLARCAGEEEALAWAARVRQLHAPWILDVVQAYTSVAVFVDREQVSLAEARQRLTTCGFASSSQAPEANPQAVSCSPLVIPCCYEMGLDLDRITACTHLDREAIIDLHSSTIYTVYAIGFSPGFPYLGYLPTPLCGVPRLESPRLRVEPGSVGLTGRQTGLYPEARPGGWNLIGRTPLVLVDVAEGYFPLRTGDRVQFERIDRVTFDRLQGRRLVSFSPLPAGERGWG
jgi:inhibitor of KinA